MLAMWPYSCPFTF